MQASYGSLPIKFKKASGSKLIKRFSGKKELQEAARQGPDRRTSRRKSRKRKPVKRKAKQAVKQKE